LADRIASFVDAIEERVTEYETSVESGGTRRIRTEVSAARRQIAVVRRYLAPQRDALDALYRQSKGVLDDEHAFAVREQSDRITRYVEDLDLAIGDDTDAKVELGKLRHAGREAERPWRCPSE
jgi:zinc transporter